MITFSLCGWTFDSSQFSGLMLSNRKDICFSRLERPDPPSVLGKRTRALALICPNGRQGRSTKVTAERPAEWAR